ncbi:hypothetical protein [Streptomyces sp. NRRL B-24085]|uniref:hypothetical protein n=1 Tax=Streptomyces sp. NRRL B-24085 TaxID=1709476 RepID=UPI0006B3895F
MIDATADDHAFPPALAALWCVRSGRPLVEQPDGGRGARANDGRPHPVLTALAERHATTPRRATRDIGAAARAEFPASSEDIDALCR